MKKITDPFKKIIDFSFFILFVRLIILTITAVTVVAFWTFFILGFLTFMGYGLFDNYLIQHKIYTP